MLLIIENIRARMEAKDLDPAKLARAANLNPTAIYDILKGKSQSPRVDTLAKIAKALDVSLSYLVEEPTEPDLRSELGVLFARLPAEERKRLLVTVRAWLEAGQAETL